MLHELFHLMGICPDSPVYPFVAANLQTIFTNLKNLFYVIK